LNEHKPRRVTRAELERRLGVLRSNLPYLLRLFPARAEFLQEFASFQNDLTQRAAGHDLMWIEDQIAKILNECEVDREILAR
jgi:hypothetical protein